MQIAFPIIAALTLVSAIAAMTLRNLIHCALCIAVTFAGLAALYLQLGAPFVGWAQILVYVGAVAVLIVFAILLTRSAENDPERVFSTSSWVGLLVALLVLAVMVKAIFASAIIHQTAPIKAEPTVRDIGNQLMTRYVLPLETMGLLLTAAAIGAVILALKEPKTKSPADISTPLNSPDASLSETSGTIEHHPTHLP